MIAQFEVVADGSKWEVDTENLTYKLLTDDPESGISGELVFQTFNVFSLAGRRPDTEGPGAGLCTILLTPLPVGQTLFIYLRANIEVRNFTMPHPIKEIRYEIVPTSVH